MVYHPVNNALAALRVCGKLTKATAKNSLEFREAAEALVALRQSVSLAYASPTVAMETELRGRCASMKRAARLQQNLEVVHSFSNARSLGTMVKAAKLSGRFSDETCQEMDAVVVQANSARHRSWAHACDPLMARDPWSSASAQVASVNEPLHDTEINPWGAYSRITQVFEPSFENHGSSACQATSRVATCVDAQSLVFVVDALDHPRCFNLFPFEKGDIEIYNLCASGESTPRLKPNEEDHFEWSLRQHVACKIQDAYRRYRDKLVSSQDAAALKLQSYWRSMIVRRQVNQIKHWLGEHSIRLLSDYSGRITVDFDDFDAFEDWAMT